MSRFCDGCGTQLNDGAKFCPSCGKEIVSNFSADNSNFQQQSNYNNPQSNQNFQTGDEDFQSLFLKREGRLNRLRYFKRSMAIMGIEFLAAFFVGMIFSDDIGNISTSGEIIISIVGILALIPGYCLDVRRLHDLDKDEVLAYVNAALGAIFAIAGTNFDLDNMPFYLVALSLPSFAISVYLFFFAGTVGPNKYGQDLLQGMR